MHLLRYLIIYFIRFKLSKLYCWPCIAIYVANTRTTNSTTVHMADDDVEKAQWGQRLLVFVSESLLHCTRYFDFFPIIIRKYLRLRLFEFLVASNHTTVRRKDLLNFFPVCFFHQYKPISDMSQNRERPFGCH